MELKKTTPVIQNVGSGVQTVIDELADKVILVKYKGGAMNPLDRLRIVPIAEGKDKIPKGKQKN